MAWHDEWPHKACASVLLLDGKIEGWKTGYPPKKEPGEFKAYWKRDRMNDYTVEYTCFEVNNDKEHDDAFRKLAPEWFRQWELAEDLHGSPPYSIEKADAPRFTRDEIMEMVPGPKMDEAAGKAIGAIPKIKYFAMNKDETAYYMDFERETEALDWHNSMVKRIPEGLYVVNGGHIARKEIYRQYSEDISAAWDVAEKFDFFQVENKGYGQKKYHAIVDVCEEDGTYSTAEAFGDTAPKAICKAALLAKEVQ